MQGFGKGEVEVHWPRCQAKGPGRRPCLTRQKGNGCFRHGSQSSAIALAKPAHTGGQKVFLVNGLICPTALQLDGAISTDQQQGNGAIVRLHRGGQQVGHGGARGCDNRNCFASGSG